MNKLKYVINPLNNKKINVNTSKGKDILTKYINRYNFKNHIKEIPISEKN